MGGELELKLIRMTFNEVGIEIELEGGTKIETDYKWLKQHGLNFEQQWKGLQAMSGHFAR
jgi:hypothetical protein